MEEKEKQKECKESTEPVEGIEEKETAEFLEEVNQENNEQDRTEIHTEPLEDTSIPRVDLQFSSDDVLPNVQSVISVQEKLNKSIEVMTKSATAQNQLAETIKQIAAAGEQIAHTVSPVAQQIATQMQVISPMMQQLTTQMQQTFTPVTQQLAAQMQQTFTPVTQQLAAQMQQTFTPVAQQLAAQMQQTLNSAFNSVGTIGQRIQEALNSFDFQKQLLDLREFARRAEETALSFKTIMIEMGFPPHDSIPIHSMRYIVQLHEERGIEYTKRFLERYMALFIYNKGTLIDINDAWQQAEWLKKRMPILNSCIEAHFNGYYNLTIPTLLAQLEGILVEGILKLDQVHPTEKIGYGRQRSFLEKALLDDTSTFSFDKQVEKFYIDTILANFDRGKEVESDLSRHAILHGEDTKYGTKINSLKAILVFDYIFEKLNELYRDIEKSKREVRQRCRRQGKRHKQEDSKSKAPYNRNFRKNKPNRASKLGGKTNLPKE
ncbi:hypothetical protein [Bacillus thuringiensis]|uniref:hypothetical protein n=1 Tax=Bacillus thuringiensis TaxID=1428 RepID=UPI001CFBDF6D|nr:hypothetical protein [Bacillus thuringiensis]